MAWLRRRPRRAPDPLGADPLDALVPWEDPLTAELDARREQLLLARLGVLQRRGVPIRVVSAAPVAGAVRLGFADGTFLLVRTTGRSHGLASALLLRARSVRVSEHWSDGPGPMARLCWGDNAVDVVVLGLDQPD
ncbi:hypothetical protein SAMN04489747_3735 [Auraticoccus monumenti]|uniref:Uncharacterized protein n=2 Tax=Auraticoccus monumenti TaxID=675864 RepID=A0A1G7DW14_9ACTN|nr:hypothetical protein SAMN04489747_3735 [Auraticoccus monumenti]